MVLLLGFRAMARRKVLVVAALFAAACSGSASSVGTRESASPDGGVPGSGTDVSKRDDTAKAEDAGETHADASGPSCSFAAASHDKSVRCGMIGDGSIECGSGEARSAFTYQCASKIMTPLQPTFDDDTSCRADGEPKKLNGWIVTSTVCTAPRCVRFEGLGFECSTGFVGYACPARTSAQLPAKPEGQCVEKGSWSADGESSGPWFCCRR